jgi:hypothetical protein
MRRITLVLTAVMIALAGCGDDDDESEATAPAAESATTTAAEEASPLEGTWQTNPVTVEDMADTVREAGLGKFVDDFEKSAPIPAAPTTLILDVRDGDWNLGGQAEGGGRKPIDFDAEYEVKADTVDVIHADGSRTLGWSIEGDVLKLKDNLSPSNGIPDEVYQTALYTTADFQRTP